MGVLNRLKHAFNTFLDQDDRFRAYPGDLGAGYGIHPTRIRVGGQTERSIPASIYTRISMDAATIDIRHVRLDDQSRYQSDIPKSGLTECLTVQANIDQSASAFRQDIFRSLLEYGDIAIVPVETSINPETSGTFDILNMRVGRVVQWYPQHVRVDLYNEQTGRHEQVTLNKKNVALVENPFYSVMNEPNSMLQRLIRKLALLDMVDEQSSSGKMDVIIQLPYMIKSEHKRQQAEQRRKDIEFQLKGSKYGIAYVDGTEKIVQLNRPVENNLLKTVDYLDEKVHQQLGLTKGIMDGSATEAEMLNYTNRTLEPLLRAVSEEFKRKFLTKTARTQGQSIEYFRDPFKLVPMADLAELADKFTRNEIVTSNEFRSFIGMKPSTDPKADELRNSNMPPELDQPYSASPTDVVEDPFVGVNAELDSIFDELGVEE